MHAHKILNFYPVDIPLRNKFSKELRISKVLSQVLINRKITSLSEADNFLNAGIDKLLDPFSFAGMRKVVSRIKQAQEKKERVMIFGDYDVDGITSIAVLRNTLKRIGIEPEHYIPHRVKDGYGLNKDILRIAKDKQINLLITVDCGTNSTKQIAQLKESNVDTIVTDHHQPDGMPLPAALAIINPKLKRSTYGYRDLAGVGVVYKLCQAISRNILREELDLVAIGTVADVAPLNGENRIIVKEGLKNISSSKRLGIKALIESSGFRGNNLTPTFISFILSPRLNAAGRMGSAEEALNLILSDNYLKAQELASLLEQYNRTRQRVEYKIIEEAEAIINREINFKEHKVIVLAKEGWHQGVLGIVASKLADRFYRPVIVLSLDKDLCKGSGRSIKNFHLFEALSDCSSFLSAFGGHSHAVGLTIHRESIEGFKKSINSLAHNKLSLEDLLPSLDIDMELSFSDLDEASVLELERLAPFGAGNAEPLFFTRGLKLKGEPRTLARETLKFYATDGVSTREVIGFGLSSLKDNLLKARSFDLIFTARMDDWQGNTYVILEAKDIFFK